MLGMAGEAGPVAASQVQQTTPIAVDDYYSYTPGQTLTVPYTDPQKFYIPGVLANDTPSSGLFARAVTPLPNGVTLSSDGSFSYIPSGTEQVKFQYWACTAPSGGICSAAATVTLDPANCMEDAPCQTFQGLGSCRANDVQITSISTYDVQDYCTYVGDTGVYQFMFTFLSGASQRYDPTGWIALDGENVRHGNCAKVYLPLVPPVDPPFGPYTNYEPGLNPPDTCGDISSSTAVVRISDPITIICTQAVLDGLIDAAVSWDNQVDANCTTGICPPSNSKCRVEDVAFEVSVDPIDLSIKKTITAGLVDDPEDPDDIPWIEPGVPFQYTLTVKNNSDKKSHGYNVYDDLPMWLKVVEGGGKVFIPEITDPKLKDYYEDDGTSEDGREGDDTAEWCATYAADGCNGYGDIVWFNEQTDLEARASKSYTFWVMLWDNDETTRTYCTKYPGDPRCLVGGGVNPDEIGNTACVEGFDNDTNLTNNCSTAAAPTAVELLYFTAKPGEKAITLAWATSNEINNAGFNIYRATSQDGRRIKLNPELIPAQKGGTTEGAEYLYIDSSLEQPRFKKALDRILKRSTTYYYWLEDVPIIGEAELFGPESAQLLR